MARNSRKLPGAFSPRSNGHTSLVAAIIGRILGGKMLRTHHTRSRSLSLAEYWYPYNGQKKNTRQQTLQNPDLDTWLGMDGRDWRDYTAPHRERTASCARARSPSRHKSKLRWLGFAIKGFKLIHSMCVCVWVCLLKVLFRSLLLFVAFSLYRVNLISSFLDFLRTFFLLLLYFLLIYIDKNNTHLMDDDFFFSFYTTQLNLFFLLAFLLVVVVVINML